MQLFFYWKQDSDRSTEMADLARSLSDQESILFHTMYKLGNWLRFKTTGNLIGILKISDIYELQEMITGDYYFGETKLFLLLPDENELTIRLAHMLYPRFVSCSRNSEADVKMMIDKILTLEKEGGYISLPNESD